MRRLVVVFGIVVAAACGGSGQAGDASAERSGITATIEQTTAFQARALLEVLLTNQSDEPLEVTSLRLVDERFETLDPTVRDARLEPGPRRIMMPMPFGTPRCGGDGGDGDGQREDDPTIELNGDLDAPVDARGREFLDRLHDRQCGQQRVRDAVDISFTGPFEPIEDATVGVEIRLQRKGGSGEPVTLEGMRGTVVFTVVTPGPGPLLALGGDDESASVPIVVSASRCDAHALIESKKSYRFPMWISVGDDEPRYLEVEPTGDARAVLEQALQEGCF